MNSLVYDTVKLHRNHPTNKKAPVRRLFDPEAFYLILGGK